jgi:hypothetical protein
MGIKIIEIKYDDTDDHIDADETISFGLDGVAYYIDLSATNAKKLRDALRHWIDHSRRDEVGERHYEIKPLYEPSASHSSEGVSQNRESSLGKKVLPNKESTAEIREWAVKNNIKVSVKGPLAKSVVERYTSAYHGQIKD